jgi:hypothetical protein
VFVMLMGICTTCPGVAMIALLRSASARFGTCRTVKLKPVVPCVEAEETDGETGDAGVMLAAGSDVAMTGERMGTGAVATGFDR